LRDNQEGSRGVRCIQMVEASCHVTCQLEMLCLVFANGDVCSLVKKDIGGLQDRVGEQTEFEGIFVRDRLERRGILG
jgi:hypothetical protein